MSSLLICLLIVIAVVALTVKLLIPLCEKREMAEHQHTLATVQAVYLLKNKVKPGCYTFRWQDGRLLEPAYEPREGHQVQFQFIAGEQTSEKIQDMPIDFQRQLFLLINAGMRRQKH